MELNESERRATEIQAAFERKQQRQQAGQLRTPPGAGPPGPGSLQPTPPSTSSGRTVGHDSGAFFPSGGAPSVSPAREERRRPSLPGQGHQQEVSRSSSQNSSATSTMHAAVDPRRRTIRELVAASQVQAALCPPVMQARSMRISPAAALPRSISFLSVCLR